MDSIEEKDFEPRVAEADVPVLVVFTADWCAPCKWLTPVLDELGSRVGDRVLILQLNTDQAPEISRRFGVASVPTVILMRGGEEVDRSLGVEPERLQAWVAPFVNPPNGLLRG